MALAMRGESDRAEFIRYTDSLDVPSSWREGPLKISLGGEPVDRVKTVVIAPKEPPRKRGIKQGARVIGKSVVKAAIKERTTKKLVSGQPKAGRSFGKSKRNTVKVE